MADTQAELGNATGDAGSRSSAVPLLDDSSHMLSKNQREADVDPSGSADSEVKVAKRKFWGLGKKKDDIKKKEPSPSTNTPIATHESAGSNARSMRPVSPISGSGALPPMSKMTSHPYSSPSSPGRNLKSSSPAPPSPASSQIFERSVQEDGLAAAASPAIPAHITTENHIPPVLDASSAAITDDHLNPDNVEIVMHAAHQPAAVTVSGAGSVDALGASTHDVNLGSPQENTESFNEEGTSNYGALDATDVRRLSFISFADVIHAEHVDHSGNVTGNAVSPVISYNRSPSPARPTGSSPYLGDSPKLKSSPSPKGTSDSASSQLGRNLISPHPGYSPPSTGGDLTIETMRQALRKTGSGDLSGARNSHMGTLGEDEGKLDMSTK